jgi:hypothetical protein
MKNVAGDIVTLENISAVRRNYFEDFSRQTVGFNVTAETMFRPQHLMILLRIYLLCHCFFKKLASLFVLVKKLTDNLWFPVGGGGGG